MAQKSSGEQSSLTQWVVNTTNLGKLAEFERFFARLGAVRIHALAREVREPDADPVTVVRYKASQFEGVVVDDSSLDVEGARIGTNVKARVGELEGLEGRAAVLVCLVALRRGGMVNVFRGEVAGVISAKRGAAAGFLPYFVPRGRVMSFAEEWPDELNPRFQAVSELLAGRPWRVEEPLEQWDGPWQVG